MAIGTVPNLLFNSSFNRSWRDTPVVTARADWPTAVDGSEPDEVEWYKTTLVDHQGRNYSDSNFLRRTHRSVKIGRSRR
ncbi:MAG: hypothetical protein ACYTHJ_20535 [Planctomycetota bacterium]